MVPPYEHEVHNKTIFHYVTERILDDKHSKFMLPKWMYRLSLLDMAGVDLIYTRVDDLEIVPNTEYHRRIMFEEEE